MPGTPSDSVYTLVDQNPVLIGGMPALRNQVRYPESAQAASITGRVYVQFVVDAVGSVQDASVVRSLEPGCDEEALRVVRMAHFTPGQHQGRPVTVQQTLQIRCELNAVTNVGPPRIITIQVKPSLPLTKRPAQFSALLIGKKPLTYRWHFDDGPIDTTAHPTHTFDTPDTHRVILEVSNSMGKARDTLTLNVGPGPSVAADEMPRLKGGLGKLTNQIRYPAKARKAGIQGRVIVQFIVDVNGKVKNPKVIQGIGGGCDEEAVRVIRRSRFKPGTRDDKPIDVVMSMPIGFWLGQ